VRQSPDVILASASPSVAALQRITRTVPIVFANVVDPVGAGYVTSLARPGGNTTGFTAFEYSIGGKWLELLKEVVPRVTRVAVIRDPAIAAGIGQFAAIQSTASSSAVELSVIDPRDAGEMERALDTFARESNGGLIVTAAASATTHRELINSLAMRHHLPTIHPFRYFVLGGGLASYGPNTLDVFRRAAIYGDRILKGAKPSELPVQAPTKIRAGYQPKDRQGAGPRNIDEPSRKRRRTDRVKVADFRYCHNLAHVLGVRGPATEAAYDVS
jgi:putative tryptophan/tyrosine transport system substrate-binding protein